jgi:hypothetical protein
MNAKEKKGGGKKHFTDDELRAAGMSGGGTPGDGAGAVERYGA